MEKSEEIKIHFANTLADEEISQNETHGLEFDQITWRITQLLVLSSYVHYNNILHVWKILHD